MKLFTFQQYTSRYWKERQINKSREGFDQLWKVIKEMKPQIMQLYMDYGAP